MPRRTRDRHGGARSARRRDARSAIEQVGLLGQLIRADALAPLLADQNGFVADLAGVPDPVVERSRALLDGEDAADDDGETDPATNGHVEAGDTERTEATEAPPESVREILAETDVATMTPLEAMNTLADLTDRVE